MYPLIAVLDRLIVGTIGLMMLTLSAIAADSLGRISFGDGANLELVEQFPLVAATACLTFAVIAGLLLRRAVRR